MRLDKFLKMTRLSKRRTVANELCDAGRVSINGKTAKAAATVAIGDVIELKTGARKLKVCVLKLPERALGNQAQMLDYVTVLEDTARSAAASPASSGILPLD
ncbi:MAG: S4 domain-containing protein [Candidatus Melainabacteria bacterium]|nr:S4 domain-containing protein [Candidatus Melainabacteria bacterium]